VKIQVNPNISCNNLNEIMNEYSFTINRLEKCQEKLSNAMSDKLIDIR